MTKHPYIAALLMALPGIVIGISGYTFYYAKGYSYLVDDPKACMNCHVMRDNFRSWEIGPHRFVSCNGCHVPHDVVGKYTTKVEHGVRHSYVFTFGDPQVIRIKESGREIVNNNCVSCHATMVSSIFHTTGPGGRMCFDCHQGTGHDY
ncbi:cytochrome c nitrite reductase small subunit [candidate division KSB1 bacterium]|nr:cytochrome c nitrite reductase small subunit [candidate division KSB1 bacterium]